MLLGLLPLFVELALLIIYFVTRKEDTTVSKAELPKEPVEVIGD